MVVPSQWRRLCSWWSLLRSLLLFVVAIAFCFPLSLFGMVLSYSFSFRPLWPLSFRRVESWWSRLLYQVPLDDFSWNSTLLLGRTSLRGWRKCLWMYTFLCWTVYQLWLLVATAGYLDIQFWKEVLGTPLWHICRYSCSLRCILTKTWRLSRLGHPLLFRRIPVVGITFFVFFEDYCRMKWYVLFSVFFGYVFFDWIEWDGEVVGEARWLGGASVVCNEEWSSGAFSFRSACDAMVGVLVVWFM